MSLLLILPNINQSNRHAWATAPLFGDLSWPVVQLLYIRVAKTAYNVLFIKRSDSRKRITKQTCRAAGYHKRAGGRSGRMGSRPTRTNETKFTHMATQEQQTPSALELFFRRTLQEIYWSELHLRDVLETMEERAGTEELKSAFHTHRLETNSHVTRLEKIFHKKNMGAQPMFCMGMQGLFDEGWQVIDETESDSAHRDAALIVAAQKVEHYEIATYGSLRTLAKTLGCHEAVDLLEQTLAEEKMTDGILTQLAEKGINADAHIESAAEEKSPPPDTGSITTESEPSVSAMKEATTGLDAGASSADAREAVEVSAPGSADAMLVDDDGQPKGKKRRTARK